MKRYLLFAGEDYYPGGGWLDFIGSGSDVERLKLRRPSNCDWAQIVDGRSAKIILVWDEYPNVWGTPDEVQAASDAKWAEARKQGLRPGFTASVGASFPLATSAELKL